MENGLVVIPRQYIRPLDFQVVCTPYLRSCDVQGQSTSMLITHQIQLFYLPLFCAKLRKFGGCRQKAFLVIAKDIPRSKRSLVENWEIGRSLRAFFFLDVLVNLGDARSNKGRRIFRDSHARNNSG